MLDHKFVWMERWKMKKRMIMLCFCLMMLCLPACGSQTDTKDAGQETSDFDTDKDESSDTDKMKNEGSNTDEGETGDNQEAEEPIDLEKLEKESPEISQEPEQDMAKMSLEDILSQIDSKSRPGTPGNSLTSARLAAELLDWGSSTDLTTDEIKTEVTKWMESKEEDEQSEFEEKLYDLDDSCQMLMKDNAKELLEEAGCTDTGYPWDKTAMNAVDAVMDAAGLR